MHRFGCLWPLAARERGQRIKQLKGKQRQKVKGRRPERKRQAWGKIRRTRLEKWKRGTREEEKVEEG